MKILKSKFLSGHPFIIISALSWLIIVFISYQRNIQEIDNYVFNLALNEARTNFERDVIYRRWVTLEGGVYVPVSEYTQPNPYLNVPNRDVQTTDGQKLTLVNPAYMTRMVYELGLKDQRTKGHITSLNPIRPANKADAWESKALNLFEDGIKEFYEIDTAKGLSTFRYMAPFVTEKACLKCHAEQGYKEGDIRGGISISVPFDNYSASAAGHKKGELIYHLILGLVGLTVLLIFNKYSGEIKSKQILYESLKKEKELNELKSRFITTASHEFRTPLTIIQSYTELMLLQIPEDNKEKFKRYTSVILNSVSSMTGMIEELLMASRAEEKKITFNPEPIDLFKFLNDFLERSILDKNKNHNIELNYLCETKIFNLDPKHLNTIFLNLISNAQKYSAAENKILLTVNCDSKYLNINVADKGIGIPGKDIPFVFERFHRAANCGSVQGTGLGLSIVKYLVELHNGDVSVESELNKGTVFKIRIALNIKVV